MSVTAVHLSYPVVPDLDAWIVPEGNVPEAPTHDLVAGRVAALVAARVCSLGFTASVHRNLALHWRAEKPRSGVDPDVTVLSPALEGWAEAPNSLKLWNAGLPRPILAVEVVSTTHPNKDYGFLHERYADLAIAELWVLDPLLRGSRALGGPVPLQLWRTTDRGFERTHASSAPFRSPALDLWVHTLPKPPGVVLSHDPNGNEPLLDAAEAAASARDVAQEEAESERRRAESERRRAELAEERARALEVELDRIRTQS